MAHADAAVSLDCLSPSLHKSTTSHPVQYMHRPQYYRPVTFYRFIPCCICPHALLSYVPVCTCMHVYTNVAKSLKFLLATASYVMGTHRITIQMPRQCALLENIKIPVALPPCLHLLPFSTFTAGTIYSEAMATEQSHKSNFKQ